MRGTFYRADYLGHTFSESFKAHLHSQEALLTGTVAGNERLSGDEISTRHLSGLRTSMIVGSCARHRKSESNHACTDKQVSITIFDNDNVMNDRYLYAGFIRLHVLHHAVKERVYGLAMIEELRRHGYTLSPGTLYPI